MGHVWRLNFGIAAFVLGWVAMHSAEAAVFLNSARWPVDKASGLVLIPVCVSSDSNSREVLKGATTLSYDRNPNLGELLSVVRSTLAQTWEAYSNVRFVDWSQCDSSSVGARVGLYLSTYAGQDGSVVGVSAVGSIHGVQLKPWGDSQECLKLDPAAKQVRYDLACVKQHAVHQFGHLLGFVHEVYHPAVSQACLKQNPGGDSTQEYLLGESSHYSPIAEATDEDQVSPHYSRDVDFTVGSSAFDMHSIMTYGGPACVSRVGIRFGTERLSPTDILALSQVYPPQAGSIALQGQTQYCLGAVGGELGLRVCTSELAPFLYHPDTGKLEVGEEQCLTAKKDGSVAIQDCEDAAPAQYWLSDPSGKISNPVSDQCLSVQSNQLGGDLTAAPVGMGPCDRTWKQLWLFKSPPTSTGIIPLAEVPGKCLDVLGGLTQPGTSVQLWDCWGGGNQQFTYAPDTQELKVYEGSMTESCVSLGGAGSSAKVSIESCSGDLNQKWTYNFATHGLQNLNSGECLGISGTAVSNGTQVISSKCNNSWTMRWFLPW